MKIVRLAGRAPVPARAIQAQERQPDGPHRNPPKASAPTASNSEAAKAVRTAKNPPGINGTQQRY